MVKFLKLQWGICVVCHQLIDDLIHVTAWNHLLESMATLLSWYNCMVMFQGPRHILRQAFSNILYKVGILYMIE